MNETGTNSPQGVGNSEFNGRLIRPNGNKFCYFNNNYLQLLSPSIQMFLRF